jgi:hypothetical protein
MPTFRLPWDAISLGAHSSTTTDDSTMVANSHADWSESGSLDFSVQRDFGGFSMGFASLGRPCCSHTCLPSYSVFDPSPEKVHVAPIDTTAVGE